MDRLQKEIMTIKKQMVIYNERKREGHNLNDEALSLAIIFQDSYGAMKRLQKHIFNIAEDITENKELKTKLKEFWDTTQEFILKVGEDFANVKKQLKQYEGVKN